MPLVADAHSTSVKENLLRSYARQGGFSLRSDAAQTLGATPRIQVRMPLAFREFEFHTHESKVLSATKGTNVSWNTMGMPGQNIHPDQESHVSTMHSGLKNRNEIG